MVTDVFAGLPVDDFETAIAWYEIFVGRGPDVVPQEGEALWRVTATSWFHVVADEQRAGKGLVTQVVDDLERHVGFLAMRGIAPDAIETVPGVVRRAPFSDPPATSSRSRKASRSLPAHSAQIRA